MRAKFLSKTQMFIEKFIKNNADFIKERANFYQIPPQDLKVKILFELNYLSKSKEKEFKKRIDALAKKIKIRRGGFEKQNFQEKIINLNKNDYKILVAPIKTAKIILERFHYLNSYRSGMQLGLYHKKLNKIAGLTTLSFFDIDIKLIKPKLKIDLNEENTLLLARLYLFEWMPYNSNSFFLSQIEKYVKNRYPKIDYLFSFCNPNIDHLGTSYKAANWQEIGKCPKIPYLFLDGKSITLRKLSLKYKTINLRVLKKRLKNRLKINKSRPKPLKVFLRKIR